MKILFECHDCGVELIFVDNNHELEAKDIEYCPVCSSNNILTKEK